MDLFPEKTAIAQKSVEDLLALIQEAVDKFGIEFFEDIHDPYRETPQTPEKEAFGDIYHRLSDEGKLKSDQPLVSEKEKYTRRISNFVEETVCKNIHEAGRRVLVPWQTTNAAVDVIRKETEWKKRVRSGGMLRGEMLVRSCHERMYYFSFLRVPHPKKLDLALEEAKRIEQEEKARVLEQVKKRKRKRPPGSDPRNRFR